MIGRIERNFSYTIPDGEHKGRTLWSGRYCCVATVVFKKEGSDIFVLANQRGSGTPDFQGYWNCPCGFLEGNETGEQGAVREVFEETGVQIHPSILVFHSVQTDPKVSNNGNVTLHYGAIVDHYSCIPPEGGEENEVADVRWINVEDIDKYKWAFNHDQLIKNVFYDLFV